MEIKNIQDLNKEDYYKISENLLISLGYYTDSDSLSSENSGSILQKTYKKRNGVDGEPNIISFVNGFILSKIWMIKGRISRLNGSPAEIIYDDNGITDKSWYISGKCINDEIAFVCLKNRKDKNEICLEDITFIKDFFQIK